jgi:hypothetical protein
LTGRLQQLFAVFEEQQPFSQSLPHAPVPHAAAVSFPQQSLQQSAVLPLSLFVQDVALLPPQHDFISLPAQHETASLLSLAWALWRAQQAGTSFASALPVWSQQGHFIVFDAVPFFCGGEGAAGVAVWAQQTTVRASARASILCFMCNLSILPVSIAGSRIDGM